ncbi:MAG: PTS glucitol/sorbitol transporter subunit IIA [Opitutaceae bacterium]|nr:PTS glucitol/sorbitol transporter subunit IIA [Opitutaceae bacterium]
MNSVKYETKVKQIGPLAQDFMDAGILVFFGMNAPEELTEFAILHEPITQLHQPVEAGDSLIVGDTSIQVLCVGEVANENLANLGHFVVKFNGFTEPEMPGDISVPLQDNLPNIEPGRVVKFIGKN